MIRDSEGLKHAPLRKTSGGKGIHIVPIVRGPIQKQVWTVAKGIHVLSKRTKLITTIYTVANRPGTHVLVDCNRTPGVERLLHPFCAAYRKGYSLTPVKWEEVEI